MESVKVYPLRNRASGRSTRLTQTRIDFPCRKRSRGDEIKARFSDTPLSDPPTSKKAKPDPVLGMPATTRNTTRRTRQRRANSRLGENKEEEEVRAALGRTPAGANDSRQAKGRRKLPLREQNAEATGGGVGEERKGVEKSGSKERVWQTTPTPVQRTPQKTIPFKELDSSCCSAVHKAKRALHGSLPPSLLCRERQLTILTDFLQSTITHHRPGALYISGAPGTGKTACVAHTLKNSKALLAGVSVITVNCMNVSSPQAIFSRLGEELLGGGKRGRITEEAVLKAITTSKKMILVVLDEVDQLDTRSQEVLYTLFEWPSLPGSRLMLVGIANSLDLTDRILPRLQSHISCRPHLLHFPPYSRDEIATILEARLRVEGETVIQPMAIQFCARKVAAVHGDLRKALDICRRAIELVETQERCQRSKLSTSTDSDPPHCPPQPLQVTLRHVASVISDVYGSGVTPSNQDAFPLQQKLVVCTLLLMVRGKGVREVPLGKLHEAYVKVCKHRQLKFECESEFVGLCSMLETRGIVTLRRGKETRLAKVGMKLQLSDIEHALQDKVLMTSILEHGIPGN